MLLITDGETGENYPFLECIDSEWRISNLFSNAGMVSWVDSRHPGNLSIVNVEVEALVYMVICPECGSQASVKCDPRDDGDKELYCDNCTETWTLYGKNNDKQRTTWESN